MSALYALAEGDSLTVGNGTSGWSVYPLQLALLYTDNRMISLPNVATGGETLADMTTEYATQIKPEYDSRKGSNVLLLWGGTNDMARGVGGDFSAASAYARLVSYGQTAQADGFKMVAFTILPRQDVGTPAGFEAERLIFNADVRANYLTFANALADVAADSRLQDPTNATYFNADLVHLTAAGYAVVAGIVKTAVDSLI